MTALTFSATIPNFSTVMNLNNVPFIFGFELAVTSTTQFTLNPGCARAVTNNEVIQYPSAQPNLPGKITVDVTTVGANGVYPFSIDTSGITSDTTFPVFVLGDSRGSNPTVAVVATGDNFLLPGYDSYVRVGLVYIDSATGHLIPLKQTGHYEVREYQLASGVSVLNAGNDTTTTLVDLTVGDGPIPAVWTSKVKLNVSFTPDSQANVARFGIPGLTGTPIVLQEAAAAKGGQLVELLVGVDSDTGDAGVTYDVSTSDDAVTLTVVGWTDDMTIQVNNLTV
jgi:hypothetical protein